MPDKFSDLLEKEFANEVNIVSTVLGLTNDYGRLLSKSAESDRMAESLVQFANIAYETPSVILGLIRSGDIAQCYVLLRWYLELAHLSYFLWENPNKHVQWLAHKRVSPGDVRKFLESKGLPNWSSTYDDWSNVVHGNARYVDTAFVLSPRRPPQPHDSILVGNVLMNIAWINQKFNMVFGHYLVKMIGKQMDELTVRYNGLADEVVQMATLQNRRETDLMST